ncbi:hypothetical protein DUI87_01598 [Hirundo rustica rustica]|uniref:Peptidase A2 domain-containing protein n=1 Tax=Hirundo rustica rustica TaxID=333673 RepID=A0A3M0L6Z2_HIRRU|nr:hypothetical protein DUI87_01598 [Hirundo rustica rustica]
MLKGAPVGTLKNIPAARKMVYPTAGGTPTGEGLSRGIRLWVTLVTLSLAVYPTNGLPNLKEETGKGTDPPEVHSELAWDQVSKSRVRVDWSTLQKGGDYKLNSGLQMNKTNNPLAMSRKRRELKGLPFIPTCMECNKTVWIGGKKESTFVGYLQVNQLCYDKKKLDMCTLNGKTYWVGQNKKLQTSSLSGGPILLDLLSENDERGGSKKNTLEMTYMDHDMAQPILTTNSKYTPYRLQLTEGLHLKDDNWNFVSVDNSEQGTWPRVKGKLIVVGDCKHTPKEIKILPGTLDNNPGKFVLWLRCTHPPTFLPKGQIVAQIIPTWERPEEDKMPTACPVRKITEVKPQVGCELQVGDEAINITGPLDTGTKVTVTPAKHWPVAVSESH